LRENHNLRETDIEGLIVHHFARQLTC
jgi:hypothetical protein